jgi:hypothetical protein
VGPTGDLADRRKFVQEIDDFSEAGDAFGNLSESMTIEHPSPQKPLSNFDQVHDPNALRLESGRFLTEGSPNTPDDLSYSANSPNLINPNVTDFGESLRVIFTREDIQTSKHLEPIPNLDLNLPDSFPAKLVSKLVKKYKKKISLEGSKTRELGLSIENYRLEKDELLETLSLKSAVYCEMINDLNEGRDKYRKLSKLYRVY